MVSVMSDQDNVLLHMHQFYTEEARHQRTMMWETGKWFTTMLLAIAGVWIKLYIDNYLPCHNVNIGFVLVFLSLIGAFISYCCLLLLRSFYKTNLIYITMFAKTEEALNFESRKPKKDKPFDFFSYDEHILWELYRKDRKGEKINAKSFYNGSSNGSSANYINSKIYSKDKFLPFRNASMYSIIKRVFYFLMIIFGVGCGHILYNIFLT